MIIVQMVAARYLQRNNI
ncbi:Protein of unknown function [Bacillus mycoides]|uniref:Uncharacterized protein n=1 Tax=Bacillus mycoides TaxID=1405 RepID=A0A1G4E9U6_BACMY|nr:Protein of unknown function [Bacillus mycoides]